MSTEEKIRSTIEEHPIVLFMKGTPDFPQCGFSMQAVQAIRTHVDDFAYVNVLADPEIRATLPKVSNWPTFPQLFVNQELVGGCDIMMEMHQNGELQKVLQAAPATQ